MLKLSIILVMRLGTVLAGIAILLAVLCAGCGAKHRPHPVPAPAPTLSVQPPSAVTACSGNNCDSIGFVWSGIPFSNPTGYYVFLNGSQIAKVSAAPYTFTNLTCATAYSLGVEAYNGGGTSQLYTLSYTTPACPTGGGNATSCPTRTGTVTTVNPGANLTTASNSLTAGNTLVLNDGTYSPSDITPMPSAGWYINGIHGTAANPIIIEAAHDGQATIDGSNDGQHYLLWLRNSSHVTLCGFNIQNGQWDTVHIGGDSAGGPAFPNSDSNITIERVIAKGAGYADQSDGTGNYHCFAVENNDYTTDANILLQDDAAWGQGCRYGFIAYHSNGVTFRRDYVYNNWIPQAAFTPAPRCGFADYGTTNATFENDVEYHNLPSQADANHYCGTWITTDDLTNYPETNGQWYGDVWYAHCDGIENPSGGSGNVFQDVVMDSPTNSVCNTDGTLDGQYQNNTVLSSSRGAGTWSNAVFADNGNVGLYNNNGATPSAVNSTFVNGTNAVYGTVTHSYSDFYNNRVTPSLSTGDVTTNPGYDTTTYGLGAYLMPAPNLTGQGQSGADMGAHIICEYVNGSLTHTRLWPWPMESRIVSAMAVSPTYASSGGLWKTLSGVPSC